MAKIQFNRKTNQYSINIPLNIAHAVNLQAGQDYHVQIGRGGNLELVKTSEAPPKREVSIVTNPTGAGTSTAGPGPTAADARAFELIEGKYERRTP
jgi:antitoxin component of MazEF toxin-antitoxin module